MRRRRNTPALARSGNVGGSAPLTRASVEAQYVTLPLRRVRRAADLDPLLEAHTFRIRCAPRAAAVRALARLLAERLSATTSAQLRHGSMELGAFIHVERLATLGCAVTYAMARGAGDRLIGFVEVVPVDQVRSMLAVDPTVLRSPEQSNLGSGRRRSNLAQDG